VLALPRAAAPAHRKEEHLPTFSATVPFNNIQGTTLSRPTRRTVPPAPNAKQKIPHNL
jgi:hypothetical protein